jgi:hypothetical protein
MNPFQAITAALNNTQTRLVAVSKTRSVAEIMELYDQGQRLFGENKVQELLEKQPQLPADIVWHLIGHLQSNKVKYIAPFIAMIHSVDSLKLLLEINKEAAKNNRVIKVLIQIHIAKEETKFGADEKELIEILEYYTAEQSALSNICIAGLMGMATNTDDEHVISTEFEKLSSLFNFVKKSYLLNRSDFKEISMGMSSDYKLAMAAGSTLVRIGSLLFAG